MILVSACLLGLDCRYDGGNAQTDELLEFLKDTHYIPICPEQMGGLPTPREPAEITVHENELYVRSKHGIGVTSEFVKGANESLKLAKLTKAKWAILKSKSPSCGSVNIYDGTFTRTLISGKGLTAKLLTENGIEVFNENNYKTMKRGLNHEK